jgi:diaminopimelate epimerase
MSAQPIPFRKMNGLGNAFVVFDARRGPVDLAPDAIRALGAENAVGFDQMITIEPSASGADAFMRIHNRDGGEVDACGNATRCVGRVLMDESGRASAEIETNAGRLRAFDAGTDTITVDMGRPRFAWDEIPLAEPQPDTRAIDLQIGPVEAPPLEAPSVVSMGNPHVVFWVEDVAAYDLARLGPTIETQPMFPARVNACRRARSRRA